MFQDISYKRKQKNTPEVIRKHFTSRLIAILVIGGALILIAFVLSVEACKEQQGLEEERKALQKSRDSLQEHLIAVPPITPSHPTGLIPGADSSLYQPFIF